MGVMQRCIDADDDDDKCWPGGKAGVNRGFNRRLAPPMHSSWRLRILVIVINNKDVIINDNKRMSLLSSTTRGQQERDCTIIYNFVSDDGGDGDDDDREDDPSKTGADARLWWWWWLMMMVMLDDETGVDVSRANELSRSSDRLNRTVTMIHENWTISNMDN